MNNHKLVPYTTINTVGSKFSWDPYSIVTGIGETYGCYLAIVANNLFSMASRGNFGTPAGLLFLTPTGLSGFFPDGTATEDAAIQMSFWFPALPNGGSATFAIYLCVQRRCGRRCARGYLYHQR